MTIAVYSCTELEERILHLCADASNISLRYTEENISVENAEFAKGCRCCIVNHSVNITSEILDALYENGVRYVSTRTIGYDHIDMDHAVKIGMCVGNTTYSSRSVAEYTVMEILMGTRKIAPLEQKVKKGNFELPDYPGREMQDLTIGVLGTGNIGTAVVELLAGFGCKIVAYDLYHDKKVEQYATYKSLDEVLKESDILTLHMPANKLNYHLINAVTIAEMKEGAFVVNTGRGSLIDTNALIDALQSGHLSGAALDVLEEEKGFFYENMEGEPVNEKHIKVLQQMDNVILTPHVAFHTTRAVRDMVRNAIENCVRFEKNSKASCMAG